MKMKTTLRNQILKATKGEKICAIVILESSGTEGDHLPTLPGLAYNKLMSWEEAQPYLTYQYEDGQSWSCHPVVVWTKTRIIFTIEYDSFLSLHVVPRNPGKLLTRGAFGVEHCF